MPTYEYRCAEGHNFEQFQKMSDPPVEVCPACGAAAERLMSAGAGLVFKGSGFYITDYRGDAYKKAAESDSAGSAGAADAPAAVKTETAGKGGKADSGPSSSSGAPSSSAAPSASSSPRASSGGSTSSGDSAGKPKPSKD
ncbi:MAG: zinc ribbon domain-containing protein [Longimicrobiales bacterium]